MIFNDLPRIKGEVLFWDTRLKTANDQFLIYTSVFFLMKKKANIIPMTTIGIRYKSIFTGGGSCKPVGGGGP